MTWALVENKEVNPQSVYEILKHHRLLPASVELAANACNNIAIGGSHFVLLDGAENVASIFVSCIVSGETAQIDLVPVTRYFRTGFDEPLRDAVTPLLDVMFKEFSLRRITSMFPASRSRTKRALSTLGFVPEGRIRDGVVLYNRPPEDIRVLGLLRTEFMEEANGRME